MVEPTKVVRASQAGSQAAQVTPMPGAKAPPAPAVQPTPEPAKRSKSERTHEGRGFWQGIAYGVMIGGGGVAVLAIILFSVGGPIFADMAARLAMVYTARDAALSGK